MPSLSVRGATDIKLVLPRLRRGRTQFYAILFCVFFVPLLFAEHEYPAQNIVQYQYYDVREYLRGKLIKTAVYTGKIDQQEHNYHINNECCYPRREKLRKLEH